jgi:hypothetical protein
MASAMARPPRQDLQAMADQTETPTWCPATGLAPQWRRMAVFSDMFSPHLV